MTAQGTLRTGVWFQGGLRVSASAELAVAAEAAGVDAVWVAEGPVARDALITLSAIASATSRVQLGTGVVNPHTRHPAQLAASFATLDELSGGRAVCGVGIGARDFLIPLGADVSRPLATAREMVTVLRGLLAREVVTLQGDKFRLDGVRLGFRPVRDGIPIVLAATGPRMCALSGELADGIYLMYGTEAYVRTSIELALGARRDSPQFTVASPILMAVDEDAAAARGRLKPGIGLMLTEPNGEGMLEANGLDPALAQRIRDGLAEGGIRALGAAVDDQIVDRLTIAGTPAECLQRLEQAVHWGINQPQVLLTGEDPSPALGILSELKRGAQ
ncbi:MAG TPA: LLM class flavin-dependent oxidoreductase [Solirubrobacteraceae bacterium]|jgi:5,10-methylenetetrahydromethanopterin reductase